MTESTQIMYDTKKLVSILLKDQGIHDGTWALTVEFVLGVGMSGPNADQIMPTAMASVAKVGISRADEGATFSFDASELNPTPGRVRKSVRK